MTRIKNKTDYGFRKVSSFVFPVSAQTRNSRITQTCSRLKSAQCDKLTSTNHVPESVPVECCDEERCARCDSLVPCGSR
jgi:hypothetical protein